MGQNWDDYLSSLDATDVDVGLGTKDVIQVEAIISYRFWNMKLPEALIAPKRLIGPNYECLVFLRTPSPISWQSPHGSTEEFRCAESIRNRQGQQRGVDCGWISGRPRGIHEGL